MGKKRNILCLVLAVLLLSGCSLRTLDALYQVPKRSEEYSNLQSAIDRNLGNLEYCAPLSGENLQAVQMADLDGNGVQEYLLFAKGVEEKPLHILIFSLVDGSYELSDTIQSHGSAFDLVEYERIDDQPGYELIVGCQISDQVVRSVSVYTFRQGKAEQLMNASYTKFLTYDLNVDGRGELMTLRPGETDEANGVAELYSYTSGVMERSDQVSMSETTDNLKRIVSGKLHGGQPAVYVSSTAGEHAIITDVFSIVDGHFTNVSAFNDAGTSIQTLRNYYVYADDMDGDGVVELPSRVEMHPPGNLHISTMQYLIRWYAMTAAGEEVDKLYTYHNFLGGWYFVLDGDWACRAAVLQQGSAYEFYIWDQDFYTARKLMTIYSLTGAARTEMTVQEDRFVIYENDAALYMAQLEDDCADYGLTQEYVRDSFHLIGQEWT